MVSNVRSLQAFATQLTVTAVLLLVLVSGCVFVLTMNWTGLLASQALLLLITMATLVSPFLYYNKRQMMTEPSMFEEEEPEERYRPSRQSSQYPQIGARTSLTEKCQVNPVLITIRPPPRFADRCDPRTVVSYGCRGGCSSYSRVDVRNTTNLLRSCSCCSPTGFGFRIVRMTCQNFGLRSLVKFALGCHCRPCMASVESADVQTLRDLLRKSSLLT